MKSDGLKLEWCCLYSLLGVMGALFTMHHTPIAQLSYWLSGAAGMMFFVSVVMSLLATYWANKMLKSVPMLLICGGTFLFFAYFGSFINVIF